MATQANALAVTTRTEKGKGAARRARRAGNVPAVLYGHGTDPQHLNLPARDFAAILRNNGTNAVLDLDIEGTSQLALTKQIDIHPIRNYIEHVDLLVIKRGEKVTVEVTIVVEGDAAPGTLVTQDANTVEIEADALSIPEQIVVDVEGKEVGTSVHASDLVLPEGVELVTDPETLIVAVNEATTAAELEEETDAEQADADAAAAEAEAE
ncbi:MULTISPECIES: 50S ribosomal protein L25/general stress protein Ctc [Gordonia]|uniref:50S ribosomal protein L25/general stress protein Ctc n=1 Tax=Gordonia TaxID=2053 RepID=UPI0007EBD764|nr:MULTISPECIES: 50S ribosomal protein L25/general stress protein Ctc [Gordonia]MCM3896509.1 50S ribosomal protein L25/general stress protein Ctc [Gordonia sputi]OBC11244.1 50S ribosomal protein L25/general stress protein Ctc [Gordonia sp. 852002-50816_SCH5313054-c]OBC14483.1 50S ribosomal protein L25/general stress protein Ctc [Gordonia sp. 852002-50816_SCH5313054-a]SKY49498.1 50S ribosomal protein L25 [Mycobacteroides abscessus subsp. abscessus]